MNQMFELGELGKVEAHLNISLVDKGSSSQVRIRDIDKLEKNLRPTAVENQDESGLSSSSFFHTLLHQLNQKVHSMSIWILEETTTCLLNNKKGTKNQMSITTLPVSACQGRRESQREGLDGP